MVAAALIVGAMFALVGWWRDRRWLGALGWGVMGAVLGAAMWYVV